MFLEMTSKFFITFNLLTSFMCMFVSLPVSLFSCLVSFQEGDFMIVVAYIQFVYVC